MKEAIIEWKDFSFRYETQQEPTLQGVDLTIYKGEKVLIVGPSGSGKFYLGSVFEWDYSQYLQGADVWRIFDQGASSL